MKQCFHHHIPSMLILPRAPCPSHTLFLLVSFPPIIPLILSCHIYSVTFFPLFLKASFFGCHFQSHDPHPHVHVSAHTQIQMKTWDLHRRQSRLNFSLWASVMEQQFPIPSKFPQISFFFMVEQNLCTCAMFSSFFFLFLGIQACSIFSLL